MQKTRAKDFLGILECEQMFTSGINTDKVNDYIDTLICKKEPINKILRLICLQCLTNGGLKTSVLEGYQHEIIQTYGYEKIETLYNLQRLGLMGPKIEQYKYDHVRKGLNLVVDDIDEGNPNDISYAYSGYAPISVRLIEHIQLNQGWKGIESIIKMLPGPLVSMEQSSDVKPIVPVPIGPINAIPSPKITLVYFIGGVTYAEIAAIRFLASQSEGHHQYLIATTGLVNGSTMLSSLTNDLPCNSEPIADMKQLSLS